MSSSNTSNSTSCCSKGSKGKKSIDWLLYGSLSIIAFSYLVTYSELLPTPEFVGIFAESSTELMNKMWWGLLLSIVFVGWLGRIPREIVMGILGTNKGSVGLLRATAAGLVLDLCNHGILVVAMRLYERGATIGQVVAFLVASPWNSFSMTVILFTLVGLKYTALFIILSCIVALISGFVFEKLTSHGILPSNPNAYDLPEDFSLVPALKKSMIQAEWSFSNFGAIALEGIKDSRMILRWIFFGVVLASIIRLVMPEGSYETYFGPSLLGLGLTVIAATIIEVCSEGSAPIAADLLNLGHAPGNAFTFLMTGVSTDYTEIMSLKETTDSWKIALFLPLVTVPQVILLGYILNVSQ